jgi:carboxyl-terminal processing protease
VNRAIIAGLVLAAAVVSGGMLIQGVPFGEASAAAAAPASPRLFEEVMARLRRDYIDSLTVQQMMQLAAAGVAREIDEPNSALLEPDRARRLRENVSGRYAGIGVETDIRDGFVTVIAPIPGSPADSAGVRTGDRILSIDGKTTNALMIEEVQQALRGPAGTRVTLVLDRDEGSQTVTLTRREIVFHAVRGTAMLPGRTGYLRIATFNEEAAAEVRRAVDSLRATSLIVDLRNNPGGLLEQGVAVADLFLDDRKVIALTRGRTADANREFLDGARQQWPQLPIVVLIDSGTASAAEIVAGALQDHNRAVLVGEPTYGKGSAQSLFPVTGGYALKLTTARWFTPRGRTIERDSTTGGIEPDVVVRDEAISRGVPRQPAADPVVRRALQLLQGVKTPAELRGRVPPRKKDAG